MIKAAFDFQQFPEPVVLATGAVTANFGSNQIQGDAKILLVGRPRPNLEIHNRFIKLTELHDISVRFGNEVHALSFNGFDIPGFQLSSHSDGDALVIRWCPSSQPVKLSSLHSAHVQRVIFHIFGLPALHRLNGSTLLLENDRWRVTLYQVADAEQTESHPWTADSFRLTHVGEIKRKDEMTFSADEAEEQLQQLRYFLTFVRGTWNEPICSVGYDIAGTRVWESLSTPTNSSAAITSWFDYLHPEQMQLLYPLFTRRWSSSAEWKRCLKEVIYWYANANTAGGVPGIDISILLSQAALERLAHQLLVVDRKMVSPETFRSTKLRASDKLRLLLSSVGIPTDIPTYTKKISKSAKDLKWTDGPHAFSDIRNTLVHPDASERAHKFDCIQDGWKLGLWYLELALLAVCNYDGMYGNRLRRKMYGQIEATPWAK